MYTIFDFLCNSANLPDLVKEYASSERPEHDTGPGGFPEELRLLVFALCMAGVKLPLETILTARISYLQAIGSIDDAKRLLFIFNFAAVIPCVAIMGFLFGSYGVMTAFTLADLLVIVSIFIYYARKKQSLHITVDDYLHVEDECDISPGDIIDLGVRTQDECSLTAEQVRLEYPIELKHFRSMDVENMIIIM